MFRSLMHAIPIVDQWPVNTMRFILLFLIVSQQITINIHGSVYHCTTACMSHFEFETTKCLLRLMFIQVRVVLLELDISH